MTTIDITRPGAEALKPRAAQAGGVSGPLDREGRSLVVLVVVAVLVLSVIPLGRLFLAAIAPGGRLNLQAPLDEILRSSSLAATMHSLETALISAIGALALGALVAFLLAVTDMRGKRPLGFLFVMSMLIAPQVTALAFLTLAGPSSPLLNAIGLAPPPGSDNPLVGRFGVMLVLALHHAPLAAITLSAGLRALPHALIEAAQVEGAGPWVITRRVVAPLLRPYWIGAALLCFVAAVGNFGIPALLGMPANYMTLPTLIYQRMSSFGPSVIADAAALSVLIALIAGAGVFAAGSALKGAATRFETDRRMEPYWRLGRVRVGVEIALWGLIGLCLILPLLSLLVAALVPTYGAPLTIATATLDNFVEVLVRQDVTVRAFRNSFVYAGSIAILLALAAIPLAWALDRRAGRARMALDALIEAPYALPGVVLAIACILVFLRPLPLIGVSIYATPWIILFAYAARFLPIALKAPMAAMSQIDKAQEEAAALDGAGLWARLFLVIAPALAPACAAGALLVFLIAFNELTVSALLWSGGTETLGVVLFSLEEAGFASLAAAVALSAVAVVAFAMLIADRLADRLPEGVLPWRF